MQAETTTHSSQFECSNDMSDASFDIDSLAKEEDAASDDGAKPEIAAGLQSRRYKFLLGQTELFRHFIEFKAAKSGKAAPKDYYLKSTKTNEHPTNATEDKRHHAKGLKGSVEEQAPEDMDTILENSVVRFSETPHYVKNGHMRDYQIQGLNWLISLYENDINGILADEMGLGKTLQSLSFLGYLKHYRRINGPHIIIAPKSTLNNWLNEIKRWIPDLEAFVFHGDRDQREQLIKERVKPQAFDVMISSYEMCMIEKGPLKRTPWKYIIIDEAHRIKNESSLLSQINNLHELWALLNFLLPDVFSDAQDFDNWFKMHDSDHEKMVQQLRNSEVEHTLLPKKEIYLYVEMSEMQRLWYQKLLEKDIDSINGHTAGGKKEGKTRLMNILMHLRKCANHPYLFDGAEPGPPYTTDQHLIDNSGKLQVLDKLLIRLKKAQSRVLIFSQMSRVLDILEDYCHFKSYNYCRLDGSSSTSDRIEAIEAFNEPNSAKFIFLLTTRAGGLGINLSTADVVVLYDSDWNPQVDLQAQDRAHRIGQTKQVKVFRLVTENTVEEKILERSMQKLRLDQLVIQQGKLTANNSLTANDLLEMIRHGAKDILKRGPLGLGPETNQNVEDLLKKSEERTQKLQEKYKNVGMDDLQKFSSFSINTYEWEGEDYSTRRKDSEHGSSRFYIEPKKRERRSAFDNDPYFVATKIKTSEQKPPKPPKQVKVYNFQFFPERLHDLLEKEKNHFKKTLNYKVVVLPNETQEQGEKREQDQLDIDNAAPLTEQEIAEKEDLYQDGFLHWSKRDFAAFLKGCEKYGRKNYSKIANEIGTKSADQVKEYSSVFWQGYEILPDHEKMLALIERGEAKIKKSLCTQEHLDLFIQHYRDDSDYHWPRNKLYTKEEDYFLISQLKHIGYANEMAYELIRESIRTSKFFRFDWFFRSRSALDLAKRAIVILPSIERWLKSRRLWTKQTVLHSEASDNETEDECNE